MVTYIVRKINLGKACTKLDVILPIRQIVEGKHFKQVKTTNFVNLEPISSALHVTDWHFAEKICIQPNLIFKLYDSQVSDYKG